MGSVIPSRVLTRRQTLTALGGGLLAVAGCGRHGGVTGPRDLAHEGLAFNVQPLGGAGETLQRQALRRLAPPWIRVTIGPRTDAQARAYMRTAPNVLGLLAGFDPATLDAGTWPDLVEATLLRYPEVRLAELLNEPEHSNGLSAQRYVQDFLRPGYEVIRERLPGVSVVAAAPVGTRTVVADRFRRLTDAGADAFCDFRAVHVYFDDPRILGTIAGASGRPILVTETGTSVAGQHVRWYTEVVPRIRSALASQILFWYVLLESGDAYPGFSIIAALPDAAGQPRALPGSGLYPLLISTVTRPTLRRA